jgi:hypothetical protein
MDPKPLTVHDYVRQHEEILSLIARALMIPAHLLQGGKHRTATELRLIAEKSRKSPLRLA